MQVRLRRVSLVDTPRRPAMSAEKRKQFAEKAAERRAANFAKLKKPDAFKKAIERHERQARAQRQRTRA